MPVCALLRLHNYPVIPRLAEQAVGIRKYPNKGKDLFFYITVSKG